MGGLADRLLAHPMRELDGAVRRDRARSTAMSRPWHAAARSSPSAVSARRRTMPRSPRRPARSASDTSSTWNTSTATPATAVAARAAVQRAVGRVGADPQADVHQRDMAQPVRLAGEAGGVVLGGERLHQRRLGRSARRCHVDRPCVGPPERTGVVGPAGLRPAPDGRALPPPERLALHDRAGDVAVDVGVSHLDPVELTGPPRGRRATGSPR